MEERTPDAGRSPLGTLVLLALSFALGYVLGSRSGGTSEEWEDVPSEPTEITIEGGEEGEEREGKEGGEGGESEE